jgi:predicted DNA-binding protein (MmcQ/YjbR family)
VDVAEVIAYSMAKPGAEETYPWGDGELVCKVGGKAFAFIGLESATVGVKCGPAADEWRARYPDAITPSSYLARYGWNTVTLNGTIPSEELTDLLDLSYEQVRAGLPKSKRPH